MKKTLFILFTCFLILPFAGSYYWYQYRIKQVKREVRTQIIKGMDKDELVLLSFTQEEINTRLKWKHSKEFEYKGQMYDVIEKEINGNIVNYWCWWDNAETALNKQLQKLVAIAFGNNTRNREHQCQLQQFYKSLYSHSFQAPQPILKHFLPMSGNHYFFSVVIHYNSPTEPPPQLS